MDSLNKKLIWSVLALTMFAAPALAQRQHQSAQLPDSSVLVRHAVPHYPNGGDGNGSGTAAALESGAEFNVRNGS